MAQNRVCENDRLAAPRLAASWGTRVEILAALGALTLAGAALCAWEVRRKEMSRWLGPYIADRRRRRLPAAGEDVHLLLCIADHFEPKAGGADIATGLSRVRKWVDDYPRQFARFRDADGRPPRYSFFFPAEEYEPEYLDLLAGLCRAGYGEVEVHLHHDRDTAAGFREKIESFKKTLVERHGLLGRDRLTGDIRYAFIHGNWALCNSRPDGRLCGVDNELEILQATGCCVDMTYPSAPDVTQPPIINRIYYAKNIAGQPCSHETGVTLSENAPANDELLLIQGPLVLDWGRRKWGILPRVENGCLQASQPPSVARLETWMRARVQASPRPDWIFVKLHAHGAPEDAHDVLLGKSMVQFHEELAERARRDPHFHFHYVTAREMYNLAKAAEAGFRGAVDEARDFRVASNLNVS
jgi:hypothetical protein